jgi:hypothetical protein
VTVAHDARRSIAIAHQVGAIGSSHVRRPLKTLAM